MIKKRHQIFYNYRIDNYNKFIEKFLWLVFRYSQRNYVTTIAQSVFQFITCKRTLSSQIFAKSKFILIKYLLKIFIILFNCCFYSIWNIIFSYDTFNLLFSFQHVNVQVPSNFFSHSIPSFHSFFPLSDPQQSIVTYLVPSFLRQIDRDPSRVGTLRLKLRYPFDPAAGSIVVSISFLHLFPLTSWLHVLFLCRGRFLTWIVPHFPTGNPVGSLFRDEKTLNDSDDWSWKSILMTQLFTDAYWFLIESFCSIRSRNCAGIGN